MPFLLGSVFVWHIYSNLNFIKARYHSLKLKMQNTVSFNILDEEFRLYMKSAFILVEKLIGPEKDIAINWLRRLASLQANDMSIKRDRNHFSKKLLSVIKQSVYQRILNHPKHKLLSVTDKYNIKVELLRLTETLNIHHINNFFMKEDTRSSFMSMWSSDRRTYVAAKPVPGRGALIYMAVAEKPEAGWIIPQKNTIEE